MKSLGPIIPICNPLAFVLRCPNSPYGLRDKAEGEVFLLLGGAAVPVFL